MMNDALAKRKIFEEWTHNLYLNDENHLEFTPVAIAEEICEKISDWSGDVCVFYCVSLFRSVLSRMKRQFGIEYASEHLTFIASNVQKIQYCEGMLGKKLKSVYVPWNELNVWLKEKEKMKFSVIVGNPPYQNSNNVSTKLWPQFIEKSFSMLEDDGLLLFLTPQKWTSPIVPSSNSYSVLINKIMFGNSLLYTDFSVNKFFDVGVDISAWLLKKDGKESAHKFLFTANESIANKLVDTFTDRFVNADSTVWSRKKTSMVKTSEYCIPIVKKRGIEYSNVDDKDLRNQMKIVFLRELGYYPKLDELGEYGFNWQSRAMIFKSKSELKNAWEFFNSPLMLWAMKHLSWTPQCDFTLLSMIKLPDFSKKYTTQELYEYYSFTTDEIKNIESF